MIDGNILLFHEYASRSQVRLPHPDAWPHTFGRQTTRPYARMLRVSPHHALLPFRMVVR